MTKQVYILEIRDWTLPDAELEVCDMIFEDDRDALTYAYQLTKEARKAGDGKGPCDYSIKITSRPFTKTNRK